MPVALSTPVQFVKRIGDRVAAKLAERGVHTVEDLLYHLPFRYEDRLHPKPLSLYQPGDMASLIGEVRGTSLLRTRSGTIFEMTVGITPPRADSEAAMQGLLAAPAPVLETVKCMWFNGTYLQGKFRAGQTIALYGKLDASRSGTLAAARAGAAASGFSRFKMIQPTFEILPDASATGDDAEFTMLEMGRMVPIYESLGGTTPWGAKLTSRWLRRVLWTIFRDLTEASSPPAAAAAPDQAAQSIPPVQSSPHEETLPSALCRRLNLPSRMEALRDIHFPPAGTSITELVAARTPAHRRLIFEEFFYLELGLELKRLRDRPGTAFVTNDTVRQALKQVLPFKPTAAQKRVLGEIVEDMRRPQPMRRLLQGDVGSGKTIVAFQAALVAIENGHQVALMAPTEILATQHYLSARKLLADKLSPRSGRPYRIGLLTGSLDDRTKRETRGRIFRGEIDLAIGTHALVEDNVDFASLGLVIVDEQHRFGVQQRFQLMRKPSAGISPGPVLATVRDTVLNTVADTGRSAAGPHADPPPTVSPPEEPDVLVMTATPIPRTLALTLYGDMEASVIDELPPGRTPVLTRRMPEERSAEVWEFVRKQVAAGRQAYIVYPVIEGPPLDQPELDFAPDAEITPDAAETASPLLPGAPPAGKPRAGKKASAYASRRSGPANAQRVAPQPRTPPKLRSAIEMHAQLQSNELAGLRLGLLHGRMSTDDKEVTMARFKRGELDVLVATTVIEVGVDVPNATVMVVEHAERFGLAQLHQLRGRVGRGAARSFCVLLTGHAISSVAELRLDAMVQTQDGFALAELDLQQRGPGEFFGTRQAGLPDLRVASLTRDRDLLELAKVEAARFASAPDPAIPRHEIDAVWSRLKQQWQRRYGLLEA